ncbi:MAG: SDR family oxidoreductase [Rhodothermaceae bacterium]|nr:SDR family NAD(P)-dependent oxidoreductase [Bacteroidota bacterium]MXW14625.1 SDR family oxidoreductase [Rhodothermaceae bacterium]MXW33897.1 SDR family oxidoreductase [Rhodothermaceae bacterium]MYC04455.1 SDR family oxidoreductase [Rhodothermaceae bacterium]MYE61781.1 SDR family oxidoreductase [Rhodothermaceae bacterium]
MDLGLKGKVAVVTGASRGLGKAIAMQLAAEGCRLVICARGEDVLSSAREEIIQLYDVPVLAKATDLTVPGQPQELIEAAVSEYGTVQLLVNNAGGNRRGKFADLSDQDWEDILTLNLKMHLRASRAAIPHMRNSGGGAILFVGSIFGREAGGSGLSIYNTTKSALMSAAKIMALELASDGIRVNTLAPGSIRFPGGSWDKRVKSDPEGMKTFIAENLPIGRFGTAEEIADVAAFLLSDRASLITGACLNVDGGQSRSLI